MSEAAIKFIQMLPSCVTHLKLSFEYSEDWTLDFRDFSVTLQDRCPNLQVLIFHRARLTDVANPRKIQLSKLLISNIQVLAFHHCVSKNYSMICSDDTAASTIEVFDISRSKLSFDYSFISKMPHVKKMYLAGSGICDLIFKTDPSIVSRLEVLDLEGTLTGSSAFKAVRDYGFHLVELYMCFTLLNDDDLIFDDDILPRLEKLCVRVSDVTHKGVASLLKACKSLQHVYVGDLTANPENDYSMCDPEKVRIINGFEYCDHYAKVDFMHL